MDGLNANRSFYCQQKWRRPPPRRRVHLWPQASFYVDRVRAPPQFRVLQQGADRRQARLLGNRFLRTGPYRPDGE